MEKAKPARKQTATDTSLMTHQSRIPVLIIQHNLKFLMCHKQQHGDAENHQWFREWKRKFENLKMMFET
jgi:hypothetical protein